MTLSSVARVLDFLATAFVIGATAWFFFLQSPALLKSLGRDRFVPLQMRLTALLFRSLTVALLLMVAACSAHAPLASRTMATAGLALAAGLCNAWGVVPRALRAGGQGRSEVSGRDAEASAAAFASEGVGRATQTLHRLVVLFVLLMVAGAVAHGLHLLAA